MVDLTLVSRFLIFVLAALLELDSPLEAHVGELPRLSRMVNDAASSLETAYAQELEGRLARFNEKTGYAIVAVVIPSGEDEDISGLIAQLFAHNKLEEWGSAGVVLVLITAQEGWVVAEPSQKIENKFLRPKALERIDHFSDTEMKSREYAVERRIEEVIRILDPWFYLLEPPSKGNLVSRSPTAEIIVFLLAPFLGFMTGVSCMAFTAVGKWRPFERAFVCGLLGCFVALGSAFLVRQPGGIVPGMVYYSASLGFILSALVAGLKPYWFTETVRGRKPGEKFHQPFFGRG